MTLADFRSPLGGPGLPAKLAPSLCVSRARDVCVSRIALLSLTPTPYPQLASLSFLAASRSLLISSWSEDILGGFRC